MDEIVETGQQLSEQQIVEQQAIERYKESQRSPEERSQGVPDGYNEDGTTKEELIAGKFKSQEDLLKAYQELEKKLGKPAEEPVKEKTPDIVDNNGNTFNPTSYEQEFAKDGKLSESSYKDLEKRGFTKQQVDQYIEGKRFYADSVTSKVYSVVGGEESYAETVAWASDNISADVIADYNDALAKLDEPRIVRNLEYMKLKKEASQPRDARRIEGESSASGMQPFTDKNEWQKAATNRLYGKDAKYTSMVDSRYLASRKRGIL